MEETFKKLCAGCSLWEGYGIWLLKRVGFRQRGYSTLMKHLHETRFTWMIQKDENRAIDGMGYREEYLQENFKTVPVEWKKDLDSMPCSVLEMLVGLAIRVDNEYIGDPDDPNPGEFFWKMCCNLGLNKMKNGSFSDVNFEKRIHIWLTRIHKSDGNGGIFPIFRPTRDQRKIEIWDQMMEFLRENY